MWTKLSVVAVAAALVAGTGAVATPTVAAAAPVVAAGRQSAGADTPLPDGRARDLQAALDAEHAAGMPGIFAEVREGRSSWRGASGFADVTTGAPVRPDSEQRVGSITKSFIATTLLQLVDEGRVRLDDPVGRYLPGVVSGDVGATVTVRMLLNHTSGIGDYAKVQFNSYDAIERGRTQTFTPRQLAAIGLGAPRTNPPGAGWSYSNTNYILAGMIIEHVTGQPAAFVVTRRILWPLGLWHTYFPGLNPHLVGPHAEGYMPWPPDWSPRDMAAYNMSWAWTAGALVSTTADLDRFYDALLSGRLLRPATLAEMRKTVPAENIRYGLGIYKVALPCGEAWGHDGLVFGYATVSWRLADGSRQVTTAENLSHYAEPGVVTPIDVARARFLVLALCGGVQAAAATPIPLPAMIAAPRPR